MTAAIFDTYVRKSDDTIMHFDIVVPDDTPFEVVQGYGTKYLTGKGLNDLALTSKECSFCHIENATQELEKELTNIGYSIIELSNCD